MNATNDHTVDAFRTLQDGIADRDPRERLNQSADLPPTEALAGTRVLIVTAAPAEAKAVLKGICARHGLDSSEQTLEQPITRQPLLITDRLSVLCTGVGKTNAASAVTLALTQQFDVVLNIGVGGLLPSTQSVRLADAFCATHCLFGDEGVQTPDAFSDVAEIGFPADVGIRWDSTEPFGTSKSLTDAITQELGCKRAKFATVSTCSGTDQLAESIALRTGALVEDMESAAICLAVMRSAFSVEKVPAFTAIRTISNTTGSQQTWNVRSALDAIACISARL